MTDPTKKTPRYLLPTTSQLLHEQESLRRRRQYLEAEGAKPPVMRFGTDPAPQAKAFMPPPPPSSSALPERQASQSAPASARRVEPMRFSLASYHVSPAQSARSRTSASPTPRAVNTVTASGMPTKTGRLVAPPFARLDSAESGMMDGTTEPRSFKRQRSLSENDDPAQHLPVFPSRQATRDEPPSDKPSRTDTQRPPSQQRVGDPVADAEADGSSNLVVQVADEEAGEALPVQRSPSGFPLPRGSTGVQAEHGTQDAARAVATPLPTPTLLASYTPLPVPQSTPVPTTAEFATPTYAPRRSLFASTPTPFKAAPLCERDSPVPASAVTAELPDNADCEEGQTTPEENYGSPAPTTDRVLASFAVSSPGDKRCCHRPGRSTTPTAARQRDTADTEANARGASSHRPCRCARTTPGSQSPNRYTDVTSHAREASLRAASPELTPTHVLSSVVVSTEKRRDGGRPDRTTSAHTPSPIPTEERVEESLLASAEKRVVSGSPTPASRAVDTPEAVTIAGVVEEEANETSAPVSTTTPDKREQQRSAHAMSVSPQPTAAQLIDSLTMSAQKPTHRSKATSQEAAADDASEEPSPTAVPADDDAIDERLSVPPAFVSAGSPCLTLQNVEESFANCRFDSKNERSGAPEPLHSSVASTGSPVDLSVSNRSPSFDEAQVQASMQVIADTLKNVDRSQATNRVSPHDIDTAETTATPTSLDRTAAPVESHSEEAQPRATFSHERQAESTVPTTEDTEALGSDMFFDCHSAPATAPPTPGLPEAYIQLQRDIQAISQGRSASGSATPAPARIDLAVRPEEAVQGVDKEVDSLSVSSPLAHGSQDGTDNANRGSVVLLEEDPHRSLTPLIRGAPIQQPHQPFDEEAEEARAQTELQQFRANLSVSRSPPPRPHTRQSAEADEPTAEESDAHNAGKGRLAGTTSPLPRPVTLRSQVRLPHAAAPASASRGVGSFSPAVLANPFALPRTSPSVAPPPPPPHPRSTSGQDTSDIIQTSEVPEGGERVITSVDQWRLNIDDDDQIFAISPSARVVVSVRHDRGASGTPQKAQTSLSRKRSRSAGSPIEAETAVDGGAVAPTGTAPRVTQTPSPVTALEGSPVVRGSPHTPKRSSRGSGRKSQVEQLLEMLPKEVAEEIASSASERMSTGTEEVLTTPSSTGRRSRASVRLSQLSPAESRPRGSTGGAKRARQEDQDTSLTRSNVSLSDVQVSPLSNPTPEAAVLAQSAKASPPGVTYSVVAGDVMAVSKELPPTLRQRLFQQDDGDVSPGTRKHLRHKKKMEKQRALKKAKKHAQQAPAANASVSDGMPATHTAAKTNAVTDKPSPSAKKSAKKAKKSKLAKLAKKERHSTSVKQALQSESVKVHSHKKAKSSPKRR